MKQYKAIALTTLVGGNYELDDDQVRRRRHILTDNGDGSHKAHGKIHFKEFETFGYDGGVPKGMAVSLDDEADLVVEEDMAAKGEYPNHLGGGTYELSTGAKVRGKEAAIFAEAELG